MKNLNWLGRLGWHGGKLVLLTLVIVLVRLSSLVQPLLLAAGKGMLDGAADVPKPDSDAYPYDLDDQETYKVDAYGRPWPENGEWLTIEEMTDAVWGKAEW